MNAVDEASDSLDRDGSASESYEEPIMKSNFLKPQMPAAKTGWKPKDVYPDPIVIAPVLSEREKLKASMATITKPKI